MLGKKPIVFLLMIVITLNGVVSVFAVEDNDKIGTSNDHFESPWPMFRGGRDHTGRSPYRTDKVNGTPKFKYNIGADLTSCVYTTPAVSDKGDIYFSTYNGKLYALDKYGDEKWIFSTDAVSYSYSSPAIGKDGTIYICSNDQKLYALSPEGKEIWNYTVGYIGRSSPTIGADGTIYVGTWGSNLYAINPDGTQRWNYTAGGAIQSSPAIDEKGNIYFGSHDGSVYCLDPSGKKLWNFSTGGDVISSPAIKSDGTLYFGSLDDKLYSIDPDGRENWNITLGGIESSPALADDGTIYIGVSRRPDGGRFYAINPDGTIRWNYTAEVVDDYDRSITSSPTIGADGTIYVGINGCVCNHEGYFYAINPDGSKKWMYDSGYIDYSSAAIGKNGDVYIGGNWHDPYFYAFDAFLNMSMDVGVDKTNFFPEDNMIVNGSTYLTNGEYPYWENVSMRLDGNIYDVKIEQDGTFDRNITVPTEPGNYTLNVSLNIDEYGLSRYEEIDIRIDEVPKPEIKVGPIDLIHENESIYEGDLLTFQSTIENSGNTYADIDVGMAIDNSSDHLDWRAINLSAGSSTTVSFDKYAERGDHTVWITADPNRTYMDNKEDNTASINYTVKRKIANIHLSEIFIEEEGPYFEGDDLHLNIWINNSGIVGSDFDSAFSVDANDNFTEWFDLNIDRDEGFLLSFEWQAVHGDHSLWFTVDPNGTMEEGAISDKTRDMDISVNRKYPDISLENIQLLSSEERFVGEEILVRSEIENWGNEPADVDIALSVDDIGNVTRWKNIQLDIGEKSVVEIPFVITSKEHIIWLSADYNDSIEETVEGDNKVTTTLSAVVNDSFLFTIDISHKESLDKREMTDELIDELRENNIDISNNAEIQTLWNGDWEIENGEKEYNVKETDHGLNVFDVNDDGEIKEDIEDEGGDDPLNVKDLIGIGLMILAVVLALIFLYIDKLKEKKDDEEKE